MSQTEQARVQALLASGRITEDEAEILFAALDEEVQTPPTSESTLPVSRDSLQAVPLPPEPAQTPPPRPPEPLRNPRVNDAAQQTQWVKLSGFCGDLSVEADASLSSPVVTGKATLERTPEGDYLIRTPPQAKGESNWLTKLHQAAGDVRVRLPTDMGLDLRIAAGDGEVRGVKTVKGSFTGGDFELSEAETLDLTVTAGDVTLKLRPRTGEQRLRATSGDVDVTFLAGSSVTVSGSATCGDLSLPKNFMRSGGFVGGNFEGTLGAGEARLELRLTAGDVTVKADTQGGDA